MAGIGFELKRVLGRADSLLATLRALVSGVFVVAGPWVLTVLTLELARELGGQSPSLLFQAAVTYTYALSILVFSPVHYWFTRLVSDLVWQRRMPEAVWYLLRFSAALAVVSAGLTWLVTGAVGLPPADEIPLRLAWSALAAGINVLWIVMLYISVLKWYLRILVVYLAGTVASLGLMVWWAQSLGVAGALLGLASGNLLIVAGLLVLAIRAQAPQRPGGAWALVVKVLRDNGWLVLCGLLYAAGLWLDKLYFWVYWGSPVEATALKLFPAYDEVVWRTGLSLVPGLVFFVVITETHIASIVTVFVRELTSKSYHMIRRRRAELARTIDREWLRLVGFQAAVVALLLALAFATDQQWNSTLIVGYVGAWAQLLLLSGLTVLFYLELQRDAFVVSAVFFAGGLAGCVVQEVWTLTPPGSGLLGAALVAALVCQYLIRKRIRQLDRILFAR